MESFIHNWGYIALFLYSFGGGMLALAIASVFAYSGELNIYYVIVIATIANIIGDQFLFLIARNNKQKAQDMIKKYQNQVDMAHNMMAKYGWVAIIIQKYIYGIKTLIPLVIGLTTYQNNKFLFFNILGAIIWGLVVGLSAYFLGDIVLSFLEEYKNYGVIFLLLIVVSIVIWIKR